MANYANWSIEELEARDRELLNNIHQAEAAEAAFAISCRGHLSPYSTLIHEFNAERRAIEFVLTTKIACPF